MSDPGTPHYEDVMVAVRSVWAQEGSAILDAEGGRRMHLIPQNVSFASWAILVAAKPGDRVLVKVRTDPRGAPK